MNDISLFLFLGVGVPKIKRNFWSVIVSLDELVARGSDRSERRIDASINTDDSA